MASSTLTSSDIEKSVHLDETLPSTATDFSEINEKKLLRKIDIALIPWVSCIRLTEYPC
jgi:hypothetical protein